MQSEYLERQLRENNGHREAETANDSERRLAMRENRGREKKNCNVFVYRENYRGRKCVKTENARTKVILNVGINEKMTMCAWIYDGFFLRFEVSKFEKEERRRE